MKESAVSDTSGTAYMGARRRLLTQRLVYPFSEALRLGTGYLGLAVLVATILVLTIPPLQTQVQHVHGVLVAALKPGGLRALHGPAWVADEAAQGRSQSSVMLAEELPWPILSDEDVEAAEQEVAGTLSHLQFVRVLSDAEEQFSIPGVTPDRKSTRL